MKHLGLFGAILGLLCSSAQLPPLMDDPGIAIGASGIMRNGSDIMVVFEATQGSTYRLERKLSLTASVWQSIPGLNDLTAASNGPAQITDPGAVSLGQAFYRVNLVTNQFLLTVSKTGAGTGTVTSSPAGINCGAQCQASYQSGTVVTLTATADPGMTFVSWSGACTGNGLCTVTMDAAKSVSANFSLNTYLLTVGLTGSGSGSVVSSPAGINCGADCSEAYDYNTVVTLIATASASSTFSGWGAPCAGTGTCVITMDAARSVSANFNLRPATPTITTPASSPFHSNASSLTISGGCTSGYTVNLAGDASESTTCSSSSYSFSVSKSTDNTYNFLITQVDAAGTSSAAASQIWERDTVAPSVPTFTATRSTTRRSRANVAWTMPGDDGTTGTVTSYALVQRICNAGDPCPVASAAEFAAAMPVPNTPAITPGGTPMSLDADVILQKTITFALQATDDAGNKSAIVSASVTTSFSDDTLAGPSGELEYGASVNAGNLDGDALSDVIVGRTQASTSGGLRILYGNGLTPTDVLATQLGLSGSARMGLSVDNAGDLDGDGFDDVIVGAPGIANATCTAGTGPQTGNAYIFFGGPNGLRVGAMPTPCTAGGSPDCYLALTPPGAASADQVCGYGMSVAGIGNVGGLSQTRSMVAIGAGDRTATSTRIGKTFLYSVTGTRPAVTLNLVSTLVGGTADNHFGAAVCGARDTNGDNIPDLVVGAHRRGQSPSLAGRAYLFLGGSRFGGTGGSVVVTNSGAATDDGVVLVQAASANGGDSFGNSCRAAGDLNGDTVNDFVITASAGSQPGVTVVKGRANLDAMPPSAVDLVTITGAFTSPGELAAGQDLDGDGRPDIAVGDQTAIYLYGGDAAATVKPAAIASFTGLASVATGYPVTLISNWKNATVTQAPLPDIGIGRITGPAVLIKY